MNLGCLDYQPEALPTEPLAVLLQFGKLYQYKLSAYKSFLENFFSSEEIIPSFGRRLFISRTFDTRFMKNYKITVPHCEKDFLPMCVHSGLFSLGFKSVRNFFSSSSRDLLVI